MGDLRFRLNARQKGEVADLAGTGFRTEDYKDIDELVEDMSRFVRRQYEDEEESDMWDEREGDDES